jgi:hypothetical protein
MGGGIKYLVFFIGQSSLYCWLSIVFSNNAYNFWFFVPSKLVTWGYLAHIVHSYWNVQPIQPSTHTKSFVLYTYCWCKNYFCIMINKLLHHNLCIKKLWRTSYNMQQTKGKYIIIPSVILIVNKKQEKTRPWLLVKCSRLHSLLH